MPEYDSASYPSILSALVRRAMSDDLTYGVIFDMDGVLVDSYAAHLKSWRQLASERGRVLTEPQFAATFGRTSRDIIRELFGATDEHEVTRLDAQKETIYRLLIREAVPEMPATSPPFSPALWKRIVFSGISAVMETYLCQARRRS